MVRASCSQRSRLAALIAGCAIVAVLPGAHLGTANQQVRNAAAFEASYLRAVSCASKASCVAVGYSVNHSKREVPLAEHWNGRVWAIERVAGPSGATESLLQGVSCRSSSSCLAVGQYRNGSGIWVTLVERWEGTGWAIVHSPNPNAPGGSDLLGVSCPSTSSCFAVGDYAINGRSGDRATLVEHWNGRRWVIQPSSKAPHADRRLYGIACDSASPCFAVGINGQSTFVEDWNGAAWVTEPSPDPGEPYPGSALQAVACSSRASCFAAGYYDSYGTQLTLVEHWNGTNWARESSPTPGGSGEDNADLQAVSCPSRSSCFAVGDSPYVSGALIEHWNGTTWTVQPASSPTGDLVGVSCSSTVSCFAVGVASSRTLTEQWNGTVWSVVPSPDPS